MKMNVSDDGVGDLVIFGNTYLMASLVELEYVETSGAQSS